MTTEEFELCLELYKLTGWDTTTTFAWREYKNVGSSEVQRSRELNYFDQREHVCPAYTIDDLYRHYPVDYCVVRTEGDEWQVWNDENGFYGTDHNAVFASSPRLATIKGCIELIKQGILRPEAAS
jgi:hypothetical protein